MANAHLAALSVELTAEDWAGRLTVRSAIDGAITNGNVRRYRDLASRHLETLELRHIGADTIFLRARTNQSLIQIAEAARTWLYHGGVEIACERRCETLQDQIRQDIACMMRTGEPIAIEKIVSLRTSLDRAISECGLAARQTIADGGRFASLAAAHARAWAHLWDECDIALELSTTPDTELKLRLHMFHLLQTISAHTDDRDVGVPARGWHGEGYRGHIFSGTSCSFSRS